MARAVGWIAQRLEMGDACSFASEPRSPTTQFPRSISLPNARTDAAFRLMIVQIFLPTPPEPA